MTKVIGVRFRTAGKIYFFDPLDLEIKRSDHVIVETARGIEFGTVVSGVTEVDDSRVVQPLKPVIRVANQRDLEQEEENKRREKEAYHICLEKIREHELDMKLIDAEYTFDNNKVLFYFTADGRIDFRELVKDLAGVFRTRIELRQIGVRDETKIVGGMGICGRPLCCHSYLSDFVPVSIKMAKEQNLSLNPTKISGVCGRLMCCLKNEEETYEELNRHLPNIGDYVSTEDGLKGEVHSVNVLRQLVKVVVDMGDEKEIKEYHVNQLHFRRKHGRKEKLDLSKEEMQELERLEEKEQQESIEDSEGESVIHESIQRQGGRNHQDRHQGERRQNSRNRDENKNREEVKNREETKNRVEAKSREETKNRVEARNREEIRHREESRSREETKRREETRNREETKNRVEARNRTENKNREESRGRLSGQHESESNLDATYQGEKNQDNSGRRDNERRQGGRNRYGRRKGRANQEGSHRQNDSES